MSSTSTVDPSSTREPGPPPGHSGGVSAVTRRRSGIIRGVSVVLIVVALFVIVRALPVDRAIDLLKSKVDGLGFWGPLAFGAGYIFAALAFIPGSALTFAAAPVFGLVWGTVTVSLASTTAAAFAFLIARYLARDKVAAQARKYPKFQAIDGAIGEGGWKIIAMLRLSPAMPFSLGNYLFGLTSIRFWPYILASWLFMLPGTFMFVYLGHISTEGLRSASGGQQGKTPAEWALLGVGLLATVAVSVYVAKLSKKALRERTRIDEQTVKTDQPDQPADQMAAVATDWPWGTTILAAAAVAMLAIASYAHQRRDALKYLFGPPSVTLQEAYQPRSDGRSFPPFDHSTFDRLLRKHVDDDGWVDYEGLRGSAALLDSYIASLGEVVLEELGRDERLALLINAYNAFTLRLILDHYPIGSIRDIPSEVTPWDIVRWRLGPMTLSLAQLEHEQIRPKFAEPRVHFALVCAAIGCPKLRNEAYYADRLEEQLEEQARYVHSHDRWFRFQPGATEVHLTRLYEWYGGDFKQMAGSVLDFAARYSSPLRESLDRGVTPQIRWLDYNWTLNDKKNYSERSTARRPVAESGRVVSGSWRPFTSGI